MSLDYPNRADWLAKRCTPRGQKHERPYINFGQSARERLGKAGNRAAKKARMATLHASFMNDDALMDRADDLGLLMFLPEQIRRVRDTVLGSR